MRDFEDKQMGDEYLFRGGPRTYTPRVEEKIVREVKAETIKSN